MENNIKRLDIKEFRESGYLQELNRRFLHPLGLALEVSIDEDGKEELSSIWDCRTDAEGLHYAIKSSGDERKLRFRKNKNFIDKELKVRRENRRRLLGFDIEPVE